MQKLLQVEAYSKMSAQLEYIFNTVSFMLGIV